MLAASRFLWMFADLRVLREPSRTAFEPWTEGTDGYGDDCRPDGHYAAQAG